MIAIHRQRLECTEGNHYKQYTVWVERHENGGYVVNFHYGRIGKPPVVGTKTATPLPTESRAKNVMNLLIDEKIEKGYKMVPWKHEPTVMIDSPGKNPILVVKTPGKVVDAGGPEDWDKPKKKGKKDDDKPKRNLII